MKIYFLDYGWLEGDINWMVALTTYATRANKQAMSEWAKFPEYGVLVETEGQYLLYDTGSHRDDIDRSSRFPFYCNEGQGVVNQLKSIGLSPADIHSVVLSHLHDDHAGNIDLFSHATVYIDKDEYHSVAEKPNDHKIMQLSHVVLVSENVHLTPHIELRRLPGHSAGLLGMYLHSVNQPWFMVSDAANTIANYSIPPKAAIGLFDEKQYFQTIEEIRKTEVEQQARIFFGHDFTQFQQLRKCPEYYELEI